MQFLSLSMHRMCNPARSRRRHAVPHQQLKNLAMLFRRRGSFLWVLFFIALASFDASRRFITENAPASLMILRPPKGGRTLLSRIGTPDLRYSCLETKEAPRIFVVWAFVAPPSIERIRNTLVGLRKYHRKSKVTIICGSDACMEMSLATPFPCLEIKRFNFANLFAETPLEHWVHEQISIKILAAHYYEEYVQAAAQVVAAWKFGGIVLGLGAGLSASLPRSSWIATSGSPGFAVNCVGATVAALENSNVDGSHIMHGGILGMSAEAKSDILFEVLDNIRERFARPYEKSNWPAKFSIGEMIVQSAQARSCCSSEDFGAFDPRCLYLRRACDLGIEEANIGTSENHNVHHHYGVLSYNTRRAHLQMNGNPGMNVGDEMQGLAGLQFMPFFDTFVERDRLDLATSTSALQNGLLYNLTWGQEGRVSDGSELITIFLNGWYGTPTMIWPPRDDLDPILVSIHLQPGTAREIVKDRTSYLRQRGPIGARDPATLEFFGSIGLPSFFSGCMTLTLSPWYDEKSEIRQSYYIVDVAESIRSAVIPPEILMKANVFSHKILDQDIANDGVSRYLEAFQALKRYASAKLVITQRLHVALPCIAMRTPVILLQNQKLPGGGGRAGLERLAGLSDLAHSFDTTDNISMQKLNRFEWNFPPPNPLKERAQVLAKRLRVLAYCNSNIRDSGKSYGVIPATWAFQNAENFCSERPEKEEMIHIATSFDMRWFSAFPTWISSIARSNRNRSVYIHVFTNEVTDTVKCLLSWIVESASPSFRANIVAMDQVLKKLNYTPSRAHEGRISKVTQARLFLSSVFPCLDKIIWLDLDSLVLKPLDELWNVQIKSKCGVAARNSVQQGVFNRMTEALGLKTFVIRKRRHNGFNAGVMVLNLAKLRENHFEANIVSYFAGVHGANDQIVYNLACNGTHDRLDPIWNVFRSEPNDPARHLPPMRWGIIHFTGRLKPFFLPIDQLGNSTHIELRMWGERYRSIEDALVPDNITN